MSDMSWRRDQALLAAAAALTLVLGLLVYGSGRDPARAALLPAMPWLAGTIDFGTAGQWLPSLAHCMAFGLLTALALAPRRAWQLAGCAAWATIDSLFELGQLPSLAAAWQHAAGPGLISDYLVRGTFDPADIVAAWAGAVAAMGIVYAVSHTERRHDRIKA